MEQIILCRCVFGGYDFCECSGNGVIIIHEGDDYKWIKVNNIVLPNTPAILTLIDKIKRYVRQDDDKFLAIITNFKNLIPKQKIVIQNLQNRITDWRNYAAKISIDDLKIEVEAYIKRMEAEIEIVRIDFSESKKMRHRGSYLPKTAWQRKRRRGK